MKILEAQALTVALAAGLGQGTDVGAADGPGHGPPGGRPVRPGESSGVWWLGGGECSKCFLF